MADFSLYARRKASGTLTETPKDIPDARFALPSTVNWIAALSMLVDELGLSFQAASVFYKSTNQNKLSDAQLNSVYEQLLFSFNQLAALRALAPVTNQADVARIGIVAWYYGIYGAASAMVIAADGSFQDTHAATANHWDKQIAAMGLAMPPFNDRLSSLVQTYVEVELAIPRARGKHSLTVAPRTPEQAWGCCAEYLSGTAQWEQWNISQRLLKDKRFKDLNRADFRSAEAKSLRNDAYSKRAVSFMHQAIRYRGKANYRDAIFLAYGKSVSHTLEGFVANLDNVLTAFASMAAAYVATRIGKSNWMPFLDDLEEKRAMSLSPKGIWT